MIGSLFFTKMDSLQHRVRSLIVRLHEIGALKFGDFKMKSGVNSPVYFDLRVIVSFPNVMDSVSKLVWEYCQDARDKYDHICGVPYTALPIASLVSVQSNIPMLIRRKEAKDYGTRKLIEGNFQRGDKCLIIEDVVTTGSSILDTVKDLRNEGLEVCEAIVVVDREQGGVQNLANHGLKMKFLCTLSQIMNVLCEEGRVTEEVVNQVKNYISSTQIPLTNYLTSGTKLERLTSSYKDRANSAKSLIASKLFLLMSRKCSNLCLSADTTSTSDLLELASEIGPYICVLKLHVDILKDFNAHFIEKLTSIATKNDFLILEDRKFADIGHIAHLQYSEGVHHIANWADLVTVHPLPGRGILDGLRRAVNAEGNERGCFVVVEMSTEGNLNTSEYKTGALKLTSTHPDFVAGIVSQTASLLTDPGMIQLTPGVQLTPGKDDLGQQYRSPEHVILERGADIAVVGRGIIRADNIHEAAKEFQVRLWKAYEKRISKTV